MNYDLYRYIFIGGLVLSIIMLVVTVAIFFFLNIKAAIGDITGSNKRKAVENIRNKNASNESKKQPVKFDYESKTTSAKLAADTVTTTKISTQDRYDSMPAGETSALSGPTSETTVLSQQQAVASVNAQGSETTVLNAPVQEAEPAKPSAVAYQPANSSDPEFCVEVDITYVHSEEVIR